MVTTTYSFDQDNRLTHLQHIGQSNQNYASFGYTYDVANRIVRIDEKEQSILYNYNTRDELVGANYSDTNRADESFQFDPNGNRIASNAHGSSYQTGAANRLLSDGIYNYTYDREGNLSTRTEISTRTVRTFQWDYRNRLISLSDRNANGVLQQIVTFAYDAFDRRIAKAVDATPLDEINAAIEQHIYNGEDVILDFSDSDGADAGTPQESARYLQGPGMDNLLAFEAHTVVSWVLQDHLGSTRTIISSAGAFVQSIFYDSFGKVITVGTPLTRYLYTGREHDTESELLYNRARSYDSSTGRFATEDPAVDPNSFANPFSYVANNPITYVDPSGTLGVIIRCLKFVAKSKPPLYKRPSPKPEPSPPPRQDPELGNLPSPVTPKPNPGSGGRGKGRSPY